MKRRRHTPEQIIRKLREADRLLAEGQEIPEVAKQLEVSEATYHRWRAVNGPHLVALVRAGARFERGRLVERGEQDLQQQEAAA